MHEIPKHPQINNEQKRTELNIHKDAFYVHAQLTYPCDVLWLSAENELALYTVLIKNRMFQSLTFNFAFLLCHRQNVNIVGLL